MGQAHADAYRRAGILYRNLPRTPTLYAIADQNEVLAERARRRLGFEKAYGDWRQLIEDPEVHVVDIATPNFVELTCPNLFSDNRLASLLFRLMPEQISEPHQPSSCLPVLQRYFGRQLCRSTGIREYQQTGFRCTAPS